MHNIYVVCPMLCLSSVPSCTSFTPVVLLLFLQNTASWVNCVQMIHRHTCTASMVEATNIWLNSQQQLAKLNVIILSIQFPSYSFFTFVCDLGMFSDQELTFVSFGVEAPARPCSDLPTWPQSVSGSQSRCSQHSIGKGLLSVQFACQTTRPSYACWGPGGVE